jgi:serine-type D-Ala-D-Ala carboxypeptidase (penicillin-binding protein 5/6)
MSACRSDSAGFHIVKPSPPSKVLPFSRAVNFSRKFSLAISLALALVAQSALAGAASYLVVDSQTGYVLMEQRAKDKRQVGSLTKIATACVVLDWAEKKGGDLNQFATIAESDFSGVEKNEIGWQPGDAISLRDLLYAALVQSDNIAANALARSVGETLTSALGGPANARSAPTAVFVGQMNALAKSLQMERTRFANPTGYDQRERPMPFSTALDLARLTRYAMNKASFRFYVSQKERDISLQRGGKMIHYMLRTTNDLLGTNGIDGVKTGQTARAGECVILSANREAEVIKNGESATVFPRHLIVVVLGSTDRFGDGDRLVRQGWQLYDQWAAAGRLVDPKRTL